MEKPTDEDLRLLEAVTLGSLQVYELKHELKQRSLSKTGRKAELGERLRVALEADLANTTQLSKLRATELAALPTFTLDQAKAKLASRGLDTVGGPTVLGDRLKEALEQEMKNFEEKSHSGSTTTGDKENRVTSQTSHQSVSSKPTLTGKSPEPVAVASPMTDDLRQEIERKRQRALELKASAETTKKVKVNPPNVAPASPSISSSRRILNPYAARAPTKASPPSPAIRSVVAAASAAAPSSEDPQAKPCIRCDSTDPNSICFVWQHSGDIHRERGPTGWDIFRYDCCGRLDPNPCFVGRHTYHLNPRIPVQQIQCHCHLPAQVRQTQKKGPNHGRYFYRCAGPGRGDCNFFFWVDEALNLPRQQVIKVPLDGLDETHFPYVNPFGERSFTDKAEKGRSRLIGALLLSEMCQNVDGSRGYACSMLRTEDIVGKAIEACKGGTDAILKQLRPMTKQQIGARFCPPEVMVKDQPTESELEKALDAILKQNPLIQKTVKTQNMGSLTFVELRGLETFLAV